MEQRPSLPDPIFLASRHPDYNRGMDGIPAAVAVAFAASCVWLGVRIFNRGERWAKWLAVAIVVALVAYPLSLGPACWISSRFNADTEDTADIVSLIYNPLIFECPGFVSHALQHYSQVGAAEGWHWRQVQGGWSNLSMPGAQRNSPAESRLWFLNCLTTIVLPVLGVAFAAFCVWLALRIFNRGEKWAKWTAVALIVVFAYPMSFGPFCW